MDLHVTMHIDFPYGIDIEAEQQLIEEQAQRLKREYEEDKKSGPRFDIGDDFDSEYEE